MSKSKDELIQQAKDQLLSMHLDGVRRFPHEIPALLSQEFLDSSSNSVTACKNCVLSHGRQRVVVSQEFLPKKIFVLLEFPTIHDENCTEGIVALDAFHGVIVNLLKKLNLFEFSHFSYALKCVPRKGIPHRALSICAQSHLKKEIDLIAPKIVLCFGRRAFSSFLQAISFKQEELLEENQSFLFVEHLGVTVYFLSSAKDLFDFPEWRMQVWEHIKQIRI